MDEIFLLKCLSFTNSFVTYLSTRNQDEQAKVMLLSRDMMLNLYTEKLAKQMKESLADNANKEKEVESIAERMMYCEWLQINSMKAHITFQSTPWRDRSVSGTDTTVLERMLYHLGSFSNLDAAPFKLNSLCLERSFNTLTRLQQTIIAHYTRQAIGEWYKIIGSAHILGSPVTLVDKLGTGVYDFFHEPAQGFVAGPEAFAVGLAKGTHSLLKNTVTGVFGSASKFTGAVSDGLVKAGMDEEWERARQEAALRRPKHVGEGLQQGLMGMVEGIGMGVAGVVIQPVRGFEEEGGIGLVKGIGRGAAGLVLRPTVGIVDIFTKTTEGIENMGHIADAAHLHRIRPPRSFLLIQPKLMRPFEWEASAAALAAEEVDGGQYSKEEWQHLWTLSSHAEGLYRMQTNMHSQVSGKHCLCDRNDTFFSFQFWENYSKVFWDAV